MLSLLLIPVYAQENSEMLTISGVNDKHGIFLAKVGDFSKIVYRTEQGISEHYESKIKEYNSGSFSMKNPESGIALWVHPINDTQFKIGVLTSMGYDRFIGNVIDMQETSQNKHSTKEEKPQKTGDDILEEYWENRSESIRPADKKKQ